VSTEERSYLLHYRCTSVLPSMIHLLVLSAASLVVFTLTEWFGVS